MKPKNYQEMRKDFYRKKVFRRRHKLEVKFKELKRKILSEKLLQSSLLCREESLKVCREFEALPDPIPG